MLRELEFARRSETGIEIRPEPLRFRWDLSDLTTTDGHIARGSFACSLRALPDLNELKMFDEAIMGSRPVAMITDVTRYFAEAILAAARKYSGGVEAKILLADQGRLALGTALMEAANAVAFGCGVEILQPAQVDLDCPTLQRQRFEEMDRQAAQRRAADQVDQLRRSAELLKQFEAIRAAAPELSAGQILSRISATDQGDVFRAMALASWKNSAPSNLWAVAGNSLIKIEGESVACGAIEVPANLGPIRSVRGDANGGLLLGCQSGVMRVDANAPDKAIEYRDPEVTTRLGFNAAVIAGDRLWATHSEAGLVAWALNQPEKPVIAIRLASCTVPKFSPRNLWRLGNNRIVFSSGGQLLIGSSEGEISPIGSPANSDVIAILAQENRIVTSHADGQVCTWTGENFDQQCRQRRSGRIAAAATLPWMGDARLLLATEDGPIVCVGADDELLTQFTGPYPGLRIVAAAGDAVAAVTPDRQRIVLWRPWDGKKPIADLFVYGLAKHRITDLAFV